MILGAGPDRSGTAGDPAKIQSNADAEIFHPVAERVLACCDGCLRIGGPSEGADQMVSVARQLDKIVYLDIRAVP